MYTLDDTIAAISTPPGYGGIGIVRLSGPQSLAIARQLFHSSANGLPHRIASHTLHHGHIVDPDSGRIVDEVLLSYMQAPRSYTCEDVVEINAHGGPIPLQKILELCLDQGARSADRGEYTLRAFLNGRLDLSQAEAVMDLISAKTDAARQVAVNQLGGRLSAEIEAVRTSLLQALAYLEAAIDFPEDVPDQDIVPPLEMIVQRLDGLLEEAAAGMIYRQGVRTAIVGRPNVGKSSLLNRLLRTERAIVTPVPGTTRDTLEDSVSIQGVPLVLVDTAGISETDDLVERLGIDRTRAAIAGADLVLVVFDCSVPPTSQDRDVASLVSGHPCVVALNKSDLAPASEYSGLLEESPRCHVSALTGEGIAHLEQCLLDTIFSGHVAANDEPLVSNPRHRDLLKRARTSVHDAVRAAAAGMQDDLVAIDVADAVRFLGEITGQEASEELLQTIFGQFCIGK